MNSDKAMAVFSGEKRGTREASTGEAVRKVRTVIKYIGSQKEGKNGSEPARRIAQTVVSHGQRVAHKAVPK